MEPLQITILDPDTNNAQQAARQLKTLLKKDGLSSCVQEVTCYLEISRQGLKGKTPVIAVEELVHVPLLAHVPGLEGGKRIDSFVQNVDITATVLDALGLDDSNALEETGHEGINTFDADELQGISLLPVMRGETEKVRDFAIAGYLLTIKGEHKLSFFYVRCCLCNRLLCLFIAGLALVKVRDEMVMYFWGEKGGGMERDWEYRFSLFLVW